MDDGSGTTASTTSRRATPDAARRTAGEAASGGRAGSGPAGGTNASPRGGAVRRRPTATEAFRAQLGLLSRRWPGLLAVAAVLAGLLALTARGWIPVIEAPAAAVPLSDALAGAWGFYSLVALFWAPGLTWKDEGPSDRAYHWTLPVDRPVHQVLRLAAGWVLLVAVLAAGAGAGWLAAAAIQGGMAPGDPGVLVAVLPSATVLYLVGGLFALVTDRPLLWFVVAYLAGRAAASLGVFEGWAWLADPVGEALFSGSLSLASAASVPAEVAGWPDPGGVAGTAWQAAGLWLAVTAILTVAAAALRLERSGEG